MYSLDEMTIQSKRPLGITFLTIAQVWIGCIDLVLLPFVGPPIWGRTVQNLAGAHHWIRPFVLVGEGIFLVIYAGIGIGLWKLCTWALHAEIVLIGVGALICIGDAMFIRPPAFALLFIVGYFVAYGCIIRYLVSQRVRAAFTSVTLDEVVPAAD